MAPPGRIQRFSWLHHRQSPRHASKKQCPLESHVLLPGLRDPEPRTAASSSHIAVSRAPGAPGYLTCLMHAEQPRSAKVPTVQ